MPDYKEKKDNYGDMYLDFDLSPKECYLGKNKIKRAGVEHEFNQYHVEEYIKCANDPIYFIEKFVKVVHVDHGLIPMKLYDYQKEVINQVVNNNFVLIMQCRQSGKTAVMAPLILWYAIFMKSKAIGIAANKSKQARSVVARIRIALEHLPFFLQPGCTTYNKGSIEFDNGSSIVSGSSESDNLRGDSLYLLYVDEAAHISNDIEWYTSAYPVITSGKDSRVVMTTTPKGARGMFYKLWKDSESGKNSYVTLEVPWYRVTGRDEAWKIKTIANTSERQFTQEQDIKFLGSNGTLIDSAVLETLIDVEPIDIQSDGSLYIYQNPIEDGKYVCIVDSSEGVGRDYHAFTIIRVLLKDSYEVVARYRNNELSPLLYPTIIDNACKHYNTCPVLVENNSIGFQVVNSLHYDLEYEDVLHTGLYEKRIVLNGPTNSKPGVKTTPSIKSIGCSNLKTLIESGRLKTNDSVINDELKTFVATSSSFEADKDCNDDTVATLFLFAWMTTQSYFNELFDGDIRKAVEDEFSGDLDLLPFDIGVDDDVVSSTYDDFGGSGNGDMGFF